MGVLNSLTAILAFGAVANAVDIVVHSSGGNESSKIPYGLMHEDINNAGDGGIYAELIRNRAFQGSPLYPANTIYWHPINGAVLSLKQLSTPLSSALPNSINVAASTNGSSAGSIGISNDGFWGIDVKQQEYTGSFYVRGQYDGNFVASLKSALTNETFGTVSIPSECVANEWVQHNFTLTPTKDAANSNNTFTLTFSPAGAASGSLDFNLISLFPPTYKGRENGLRVDIAEALAALDPKFLRFPGGNALEGPNLEYPWKWNETIGPLKNRPGRPGVWGYQTTDGLGLVDYLNWCTDMGLEPILAIWSGLALDGAFINETDLQPWVDDAMNEIEFVTGDASTTYGALRASLGYPEPWELKYVEVGNEDWLAGAPAGYDSYKQYRFEAFNSAIKEKYPEILVIASPSVFDNFTVPEGAAGDYHPYRQPDNYYDEFHKFDNLTASNLTLVGEFASVHPNGGIDWAGDLQPFPWWIGSVGEAMFMISTERNGDRVLGATYAPILRNMNKWQWSACMVEFDAFNVTPSTSWHTFKLISTHALSKTLPTTPEGGNTTSLFWVAGENAAGNFLFKAANYNTTNSEATPVKLQVEGLEAGAQAQLTLLTAVGGPFAYNDPALGNNVVVETSKTVTAGEGGVFELEMPELSVAVLEGTSGNGTSYRGRA